MATQKPTSGRLTTAHHLRRVWPNRIFAATHTAAIFALFYRHATTLLQPATPATAAVRASVILADAVLAFMWLTVQSFRIFISRWEEHPENLAGDEDFPALDVFICTADPYKEPPIGVVNTALSVMAYEYPQRKVSVYVSDDGGSELTLFALMEAAEFAREWIPFCRRHHVMERSPEAYFASAGCSSGDGNIKKLYESMKKKVEEVMEVGRVGDEYVVTRDTAGRKALNRWRDTNFTGHDHPAVVEILSDSSKDKDVEGNSLPNLIYVSREKNRTVQHHFKAGALNTLLRVSATMSNGPIMLTLDCDMTSNDPNTPRLALCHFYDDHPSPTTLAYVQFPQRFKGINKDDIYNGDFKAGFFMNPAGMRNGPDYFGTGCFFRRRSLFGSPVNFLAPEIEELSPQHVVKKPRGSEEVLDLAHRVAGCVYESNTNWGSKIGFRYGSLVEDYFTGYQLQCDGWKSRFCHPERAAFLGDAPISLIDTLIQQKRWVIGLYEVAFSRYNPITFGLRSMGPFMGLSYAHYALGPSLCIPLTIYAFVPQLALINGLSIFPKVSEPWFFVYLFIFTGAYAQDLVLFMLAGHGSTIRRWWNHQRMWSVLGLTSQLFGTIDYIIKLLGISEIGFSVTNKINEEEQSERYEEGVFDFGATSPMFVLLSTVATINIVSLGRGLVEVGINRGWEWEGLMLQIMVACFGVMNCWPLYGAMFVRRDKGRMPTAVTLVSVFVASLLYVVVSP